MPTQPITCPVLDDALAEHGFVRYSNPKAWYRRRLEQSTQLIRLYPTRHPGWFSGMAWLVEARLDVTVPALEEALERRGVAGPDKGSDTTLSEFAQFLVAKRDARAAYGPLGAWVTPDDEGLSGLADGAAPLLASIGMAYMDAFQTPDDVVRGAESGDGFASSYFVAARAAAWLADRGELGRARALMAGRVRLAADRASLGPLLGELGLDGEALPGPGGAP